MRILLASLTILFSVTLQGVTPPPAPTGVTAKPSSTSSVLVTWRPVAAATRYKVTNETTGVETGNIMGTTSWTLTGLTSGRSYRFVVRACNVEKNCSAPSAPVNATVPMMPAAPTKVTVSVSSPTSALVTWMPSANSTRYKVRYGTSAPYPESSSLYQTTYVWPDLKAGSNACFSVIGCNVEGVCGPQSATSCVMLPAQKNLAFDYPLGIPHGIGWLNNMNGLQFLQLRDYKGTCGIAPHPGFDFNKDGTTGDEDLGEPVYAAADGVVLEAQFYKQWGNVILIDHTLADGTKVQTLYGHVQEMAIKKEDRVERGRLIAKVGTGDPAAPLAAHLHFEVRKVPQAANAFPCGKTQSYVTERYYEPLKFIQEHRR